MIDLPNLQKLVLGDFVFAKSVTTIIESIAS